MNIKKSLFFQSYLSSLLTLILLILNLFFIKLQINILGINKYGLLVLLLSVFGTIGLLNMGIGSALVKFYTKNKLVYWTLFFYSFNIILILALIVTIVGSFFYKYLFDLIGIEKTHLNILAFLGLSCIGTARLLASVLLSYWIAKVDFLKVKLFSFFNFNFSIILILILYYLNYPFNNSIFFAGILNLIFVIFIMFYIFLSEASMIQIKRMFIIKTHTKDFFKEAVQFQLLNIINNIANPIINTLININFGLQVISYLDISLKLLRAARQVIVAYVEPLFGKITELYNKHKFLLIKNIILKYTKNLLIISFIYIIGFILFSKIILNLWIGKKIAIHTYIIVNILSIGFAANIFSSALYYLFLSIPKHRKYVLYHQLLLTFTPIISLVFFNMSFIKYIYIYTIAYFFSSLYLFYIYYIKIKKGKDI